MPGKRVIHSLIFKKFLTRGGTPPSRALPPSWPSATQLVGLRPTAPRSFYVVENTVINSLVFVALLQMPAFEYSTFY